MHGTLKLKMFSISIFLNLRNYKAQTDRQTEGQADRRTGRQTDRQKDRQTDRQTKRPTDRLNYPSPVAIVYHHERTRAPQAPRGGTQNEMR